MGDLTFGVGSLLDEQIFGYWGGGLRTENTFNYLSTFITLTWQGP